MNRRLPKVEVRQLRDDYCEFVLSNTDPSVANALRRVILVDVRARLSHLKGFVPHCAHEALCPACHVSPAWEALLKAGLKLT